VLTALPRPPAVFKEPTSKGREEEGRRGREVGAKGKGEGKEGEGRGGSGSPVDRSDGIGHLTISCYCHLLSAVLLLADGT